MPLGIASTLASTSMLLLAPKTFFKSERDRISGECWSSSVAASARTHSTHSSVRRVYTDFELLAGTYVMHTDFSYFFVYFSTCRSYSCTELIPYFVAAALVSRLYKSSHFVARASVDSVTTEVSLLHTSLYSYSTLTVPQRLTYLQVS